MEILEATDQGNWDRFLASQPYAPFLQSWTMGEVYARLHQPPVRLEILSGSTIVGLCFAHIVPARRGRHVSVPYGPIFDYQLKTADFEQLLPALIAKLSEIAKRHRCSFLRLSPFLHENDGTRFEKILSKHNIRTVSSPLHLLAEHIWYLPLKKSDPWANVQKNAEGSARSEEEILMAMRKTTRNLIRRAEKDGVTVRASTEPMKDVEEFIRLHDQTRLRHGFTPYTNAFFRLQVEKFSKCNQCTVYLAEYQNNVIAASIHMHVGSETSYHHGASDTEHRKIPASYLIQWQAIKDALKRGDAIYNFWGIAPMSDESRPLPTHPFAGVTLFKTGFGGQLLNLMHCVDIPLSPRYHVTRAFETFRRWRRGF